MRITVVAGSPSVLRFVLVVNIEIRMPSIALSPKFQIVIPRDIRRALSLMPGQRLEASLNGDRIELVPIRPMSTMRGLFRGIDTSVENDDAEQHDTAGG